MQRVKFKTRIFETVYFSLFSIFLGMLGFVSALQVYDKSFVGFLLILISTLIVCVLFIIFGGGYYNG